MLLKTECSSVFVCSVVVVVFITHTVLWLKKLFLTLNSVTGKRIQVEPQKDFLNPQSVFTNPHPTPPAQRRPPDTSATFIRKVQDLRAAAESAQRFSQSEAAKFHRHTVQWSSYLEKEGQAKA